MSQLKQLNVSNTHINSILKEHITGLKSIEVLDLSKNPFNLFSFPDIYMFNSFLTLRKLFVVHPETCCLVDEIHCESDIQNADIVGSCQDIIANIPVKVLIWMYMLLILILNFVSGVWWFCERMSKRAAVCLMACNLSFADGLMGNYLSILAIVDSMYAGDTAYVAMKWKTSALCKALGFILLLSVKSSTLFTLLIAVDRFICIVLRPFQGYGLSKLATKVLVTAGWLLGALFPSISVSILPVNYVATSSTCFLISASLSGIYSFFHLLFDSCVFIVIILSYIPIIVTTMSKKTSIQNTKHSSSGNITMRLGLIIFFNFLSWFTISTLTLLNMLGVPLPPYLEHLLGLLLFPLNSLLNPLIYTILTSSFIALLRSK
jgi:hypothetical protein